MNQKVVRRVDAIRSGLKRYFTGKPCVNGEVAERLVSGSHCLCDKCREGRSKQTAEWTNANREVMRQSWLKYKRNNPEKIKETSRRYRAERPDTIRHSKRKYRSSGSEVERIGSRRWRAKNPEKVSASSAKARAVRKQAIPSWFSDWDQFVIEEAFRLSSERELETGFPWHVDHMLPILADTVCGLHCAENIQLIPAVMNLSKSNRLILTERYEWLRTSL